MGEAFLFEMNIAIYYVKSYCELLISVLIIADKICN